MVHYPGGRAARYTDAYLVPLTHFPKYLEVFHASATRVAKIRGLGRAELEPREPRRNEPRGIGTWKRARRRHLGSPH